MDGATTNARPSEAGILGPEGERTRGPHPHGPERKSLSPAPHGVGSGMVPPRSRGHDRWFVPLMISNPAENIHDLHEVQAGSSSGRPASVDSRPPPPDRARACGTAPDAVSRMEERTQRGQ